MGIEQISDNGAWEYKQHLVPSTRRELDAVAMLKSFVEEGRIIVGTEAMKTRLAEITSGWDNLRTVKSSIYASGLGFSIPVFNPRKNESTLCINTALVKSLCELVSPGDRGYVDIEREARYIRNYLGSMQENQNIADEEATALSRKALEATFYARLRDLTEVSEEKCPYVEIDIERFGTLNADDGELFPYDSHLFDLMSCYEQWGTLLRIDSDGLNAPDEIALANGFKKLLNRLHYGSLHQRDDTVPGVNGHPVVHLKDVHEQSLTPDEASMTARMPCYTYDVQVSHGGSRIRIASLYQNKKDQ